MTVERMPQNQSWPFKLFNEIVWIDKTSAKGTESRYSNLQRYMQWHELIIATVQDHPRQNYCGVKGYAPWRKFWEQSISWRQACCTTAEITGTQQSDVQG